MRRPIALTPRRRVVVLNRVEDRSPGRVAFVVHRSRNASRTGSDAMYRLLARWAAARRAQLEAERRHADDRTEADADASTEEADAKTDRSYEATDNSQTGASAEESEPNESEPNENWTKGRLYELARELDIDGRSKMNKAELLEAVRETHSTPEQSGDRSPESDLDLTQNRSIDRSSTEDAVR